MGYMNAAPKRTIRVALNEQQKAEAAVTVLAALLSNPKVFTIEPDEAPKETAKKARRCVQLSSDIVRDLNTELLFQLHNVGKGIDSEEVGVVATRWQ